MSSTVMDQIVDDVLELEQEDVATQQEVFQVISTNGTYSPKIHSNGADYSHMNGRKNGYVPNYPFSGMVMAALV